MAVTRYRDVALMPPPEHLPALHPDNLRVAFEWSMAMARLHPRARTPGVTRRDLRDGEYEAPGLLPRG